MLRGRQEQLINIFVHNFFPFLSFLSFFFRAKYTKLLWSARLGNNRVHASFWLMGLHSDEQRERASERERERVCAREREVERKCVLIYIDDVDCPNKSNTAPVQDVEIVRKYGRCRYLRKGFGVRCDGRVTVN